MNKEKIIGGHIFGRDLNEIKFVFDSLTAGDPTPIELGEILVIKDRSNNEKYLIRVTNIGYGQNTDWAKQVARGHNRQLSQEFSTEHETPNDIWSSDMQDQLFLEATCELLGYIRTDGTFLTPKRLPSYFSYVRKLEVADFDSLDEEKSLKKKLGDIPFGQLRSGSEILDIGAGLFKELLPKHIGVFAQTGGGKSNTMQVLIGHILELKGEAGMLLFEPHGEYVQNLVKHPLKNECLVMYSQEARPGVQKLRIPYGEITVDALMNVRDQMNWSEPQERFMREAESVLQKDWFRVVTETPFSQEEATEMGIMVPQTLDEIFRAGRNPSLEMTIKAVKSKLQSVKRAPFLTSNPSQNDMSSVLAKLNEGKVVLIDMSSLSGLHEILLSSIFTAELLKQRKQMYTKNPDEFKKLPPISVVLEEAQRVLGRNTNQSSVFAQVCNEGRKFGVGLIAITQQPKLMSEVLISQFNTLIILSISDSKDFDILSSISKKPIDKLKTEIRSLMPGEALISSPLSPFAVPIKVHKWEDYLVDATARHKASTKANPLGKKGSMGIL